MKKYFLMLAAFAVTAFMVSCDKPKDDGGGNGTDDGEPGAWKLESATYYGEMMGKNTGFYSVVLTNDADTFKFDFLSVVATDLTKIKPLGGDYNMAPVAELKKGTYFVAASGDDANGTIYREKDTPVIITDGVIKFTVAAGGYRIAANLKGGDKEFNIEFNANIKFDDKHTEPPFEPVVADDAVLQYEGEYVEATKPLGIVSLRLASSSDYSSYLNLGITIPLPKDALEASMIEVPVGTFEVDPLPNEEGKIIAGSLEQSVGPMNSWWLLTKTANGRPTFVGGIALTAGSVTIEKVGEKYNITANFAGDKYSSSGNKLSYVENVKISLEEPMEFKKYMDDATRPVTTITEDINLTNLTKIFIDNPPYQSPMSSSHFLWRVVLASEDIDFSLNPSNEQQIMVSIGESNKGEAISLQFVSNATESVAFGNYPMDNGFSKFNVGKALPGTPAITDLNGLGSGIYYMEFDRNTQGTPVANNAGAMPSRGFVNITQVEKEMAKVEIEFYDKFDHKITGSVTAPLVELTTATRSSSMRYLPATAFIDVFRLGAGMTLPLQ